MKRSCFRGGHRPDAKRARPHRGPTRESGGIMKKPIFAYLLLWLLPAWGIAFGQEAKNYSVASIIMEVEGVACLGQEHSRQQTEALANTEAKRAAAERAMTHVTSETAVEDGKLMADLIASYAKSAVRVLEELEKGWHQSNPESGFVDSCYRVKLKVEVIPSQDTIDSKKAVAAALQSPKAPLTLEVWTDKETYRIGDEMKFFFRGNKPFYAHAVYQDAEGNLVEVTPHNQARYYSGGVIYEIPSAGDRFTLKITEPVGDEKLVLYGSTQPMADYAGSEAGGMLVLHRGPRPMDVATRGLTILQGDRPREDGGKAEFAEVQAAVRVEK